MQEVHNNTDNSEFDLDFKKCYTTGRIGGFPERSRIIKGDLRYEQD